MAKRMVILCGNVGSGKSTYAHELRESQKIGEPVWILINQDTLGNREKCIELCEKSASTGFNIIIDRTNINKQQRAHWIAIAKKYNYDQIEVIEFKIHPNYAFQRVKNRKDHPTIKNCSDEKIRSIIRKFQRSYEEVSFAEGITKHTIFHIHDSSKANQSFSYRYWSELITRFFKKACGF